MRFRKKLTKKQVLFLLISLIIATGTLIAAFWLRQSVPGPLYEVQLQAAQQMQACMDAIKAEKQSRGISIPGEDIFETGLLGESYNLTTTTKGDLAAKRTTADANMAAMLVLMLDEAGLHEGDTLGCSFSGSFPALNLAALCACDAMGITPVYMVSCGASTWGANNPEFSFPEMADLLYRHGLVSAPPALVSPGGGSDLGQGIGDPEQFALIWSRAAALGYPVLEEGSHAANVAFRKELLDAAGCSAFLAVGGHISALGYNSVTELLGQGLLHKTVTTINAQSGLLEHYLAEDTPCMLLLNIRQLAADYGISFDSDNRFAPGESGLYYIQRYPRWMLLLALVAEASLWVLYRKEENNDRKKTLQSP